MDPLPQSNFFHFHSGNKKVLLRERKRHTDRGISSTPSVVLTGGGGVPHPWLGGGDLGTHLSGPGQGTPPHLDLAGVPP